MSERIIHIFKDEPKRLNPVIHAIEQTVSLTGEFVQLMEQFQKLIDAQASATQQTINKRLQPMKEVQPAPEAPIVSQQQYAQLVAQIEQLQQTQQKSMHHIFKAIDMLDLI
ncbi:MAG: segregation/condensation protein A, partial [Caryophanon sp.]|nr:segregation/condensation protein A [Caryophanon sp.]